MPATGDDPVFIRTDGPELLRLQLLSEAVSALAAQAARYVSEPSDAAWFDLVRALTEALGDSDAYQLLRAVEIHAEIRRRSSPP